MNKLSQILISAATGSLVTLAFTVSPLFAQNRPATPNPSDHPHPAAGMVDHQQMMNEMSQMMEQCRSMMDHHKQSAGSNHNQHHPSTTTPSPNSNKAGSDKK